MRLLSPLAGLAALAVLAAAPTAHAADRPTVLVFTSDSSPASNEVASAFKRQTEFAIRMSYNLGDTADPNEFITDNLSEMEPAMVFVMGELALKAAARQWLDVPILYADARPDVVRKLGRADMVGVARRVDPQGAVTKIKDLMPSMKALGAVRLAGDEDPYWTSLQTACDNAGIRFIVEDTVGGDRIHDAQLRVMHKADAMLVVDDHALWTGSLLAEAFETAEHASFPMISYDAHHLSIEHPAALALTTDSVGIATEAARISREVLVEGRSLDEFSSGYPAAKLVGNKEALLDTRVVLSKARTAAIDEWAEEEGGAE